MHPGHIHARYRQLHRPRPGGQQQAVIADLVAAFQGQRVVARGDRFDAAVVVLDSERVVMPFGFAQISAVLTDIAFQQVGDGHARIRRFGLVADHVDLGVRIDLAQGFRGDHAGRAGANDDVLHDNPLG